MAGGTRVTGAGEFVHFRCRRRGAHRI